MKKYLVVLLIAVLAVSSVFAGVTGYVQAKYQVNFDKGYFQYKNPADVGDLSAKITLSNETATKTSDAKTHIDAAASFAWNPKNKEDDGKYQIGALGYFKLSVDKLTIVGQDWSLDLLKAEKLGGYATSTLDANTWYRHDKMYGAGQNDGTKFTVSNGYSTLDCVYSDDYADYAKKVNYSSSYSYYSGNDKLYGTTFSYKGWKAALAANGSVDNEFEKMNKAYMFAVETPDFAFSGINMKAAAGFSYRDLWNDKDTYSQTEARYSKDPVTGQTSTTDTWVVSASFKAAYATEKFSVDFATDQGVKIASEKKSYSGDYLANVDFAPVKATVYFGKDAESSKDYDKTYDYSESESKKYIEGYKYYLMEDGAVYKSNVIANLLSFQVAADLNKYDIPVKVTFDGKNMLADSRIFSVTADWQALDNLSFTVYGKDLLSSKDRKNDADTKAAFGYGNADGNYWKENGASQKVGLKAAYAFNDALSFTGEGYYKIADKKMGFNVAAKYVANLFTANASIDTVFLTDDDAAGEDKVKGIVYDAKDKAKMQIIVGASSDKLVDGAVLKIEYKSGNLFDNYADYDWVAGQQAGKLTTTCKVTF